MQGAEEGGGGDESEPEWLHWCVSAENPASSSSPSSPSSSPLVFTNREAFSVCSAGHHLVVFGGTRRGHFWSSLGFIDLSPFLLRRERPSKWTVLNDKTSAKGKATNAKVSLSPAAPTAASHPRKKAKAVLNTQDPALKAAGEPKSSSKATAQPSWPSPRACASLVAVGGCDAHRRPCRAGARRAQRGGAEASEGPHPHWLVLFGCRGLDNLWVATCRQTGWC